MLHYIDTAPEADEWNLIWDSWARSWMKSQWSGTVRNCDWKDVTSKSFKELVDRPTTIVYVAYEPLENGMRRMKGYIVAEPSRKIIHWLYVKRDYRGQGVARDLLDKVLIGSQRREWTYTHRTNACQRLFRGMRHDKSSACSKG